MSVQVLGYRYSRNRVFDVRALGRQEVRDEVEPRQDKAAKRDIRIARRAKQSNRGAYHG